ncbi:hypothetical protein BDZ45DRAFT_769052 [Acephala macrosclerotiorum]|nr:hypothetical protein BDZ45DRAFT_769052 [Acephala macrosclerotiorum]
MTSRKNNKRKGFQTKKERNTQRRKRRWGLEHKAYEMGELCGFELAQFMYNPEKDEYYAFMTTDQMSWNVEQILARPNTQIKFSRDIEKSLSEREKRKIRQAKREATSQSVISTGAAISKDQVPPDREITRAVPFLPDPPSFDLTINQNQWHGLSHGQVGFLELLSSTHAARGSFTVPNLVDKTTLSGQSNTHPFVKRMESEPGFEEITAFPRKLGTPALLDVGRRTWIERTGKTAISIIPLNTSHAGYTGLVHGGILAALVDEGCAEYCNRGALTLYPLTKYLGIEFEKPSPTGEIFIAKVFTSRLFPLTISESRKVRVTCEVSVLRGEDRVIPVVKANALFILCEKLPQLPSCGEADNSIEDLFTYGEDEPLLGVTPMSVSRTKWRILVSITAVLVSGVLGFMSRWKRELSE